MGCGNRSFNQLVSLQDDLYLAWIPKESIVCIVTPHKARRVKSNIVINYLKLLFYPFLGVAKYSCRDLFKPKPTWIMCVSNIGSPKLTCWTSLRDVHHSSTNTMNLPRKKPRFCPHFPHHIPDIPAHMPQMITLVVGEIPICVWLPSPFCWLQCPDRVQP